MAKSTRARGDTYTPEELDDPNPPVKIQRAMLGGEPESVGNPSSESSENAPQSNQTEEDNLPSPAQTTDNPSNRTEEKPEDSTVDTTGGGGHKTTRRPSAKKSSGTTAPNRRANVRSTGDEFDEFD